MVRRTPRQLEIADHLWDCLTRIAEDCGTDRNAVVNQAVYEFARRFNFLTPMAKEVPLPDEPISPGRQGGPAAASAAPAPAPAPARNKPAPNPPAPAPAPPAKARAPAPAAGPRKTLYVVNSAGDMHKIEKDTFIIGRSRTCDLVIPSSKVSRQHGSVVRENGEYYIEDLGSANGVWRDGVKIQKEKVRDGDEFMISEEVLKFIFR
ncbi:MAG: FHA domain-containing protein [Deltaproteobacteria bacterium]|nr:FHA domain-containing protein [Deltaproteobacteria bacterium]